MRFQAVLVGMFGLACTSAVSWAQLSASAIGSRVDSLIRAEVQRGFSGAVLVARGDSIVLHQGYGALRETVQTSSRFWIASAAKQFTSAAVLVCQERGWLALDDSIGRFVRDAPADKRAITIRQLLTHTSGLRQSYVSEGLYDRETAVARMLAEPLAGAPGSGFRYSNNNYQLAVAIVEMASGTRYRDFVRASLWNPAGMLASGFAGEPEAAVASISTDLPPRLSKPFWGGEGVFSSTGDLFRWYRALRASRVLSSPSVAALFEAATPIQEGSAALGWFVGRTAGGGTRIFTRGNEDFGANSLVYAYPDSDLLVIVLTHAGNAPTGDSWSRHVLMSIERILTL